MRKETYLKLSKLNQIIKYDKNFSINILLNEMCINFIQELLDNDVYVIPDEDLWMLLNLIYKLLSDGNE